MRKGSRVVSNELLLERAAQYKDKTEFCHKDRSGYALCKMRGIFQQATAHMGGRHSWTFEECKEMARQYGSFKELREKNPKLRFAMYHNHWTDAVLLSTGLKHCHKRDFEK